MLWTKIRDIAFLDTKYASDGYQLLCQFNELFLNATSASALDLKTEDKFWELVQVSLWPPPTPQLIPSKYLVLTNSCTSEALSLLIPV